VEDKEGEKKWSINHILTMKKIDFNVFLLVR